MTAVQEKDKWDGHILEILRQTADSLCWKVVIYGLLNIFFMKHGFSK